jgi:hypothetical protein
MDGPGGRGAGSLRVPPRNVPSTNSPLRRVAAPRLQVYEEEDVNAEVAGDGCVQEQQGGNAQEGGTKARQIPKDVRQRAWMTMRRGGQVNLLAALVSSSFGPDPPPAHLTRPHTTHVSHVVICEFFTFVFLA